MKPCLQAYTALALLLIAPTTTVACGFGTPCGVGMGRNSYGSGRTSSPNSSESSGGGTQSSSDSRGSSYRGPSNTQLANADNSTGLDLLNRGQPQQAESYF